MDTGTRVLPRHRDRGRLEGARCLDDPEGPVGQGIVGLRVGGSIHAVSREAQAHAGAIEEGPQDGDGIEAVVVAIGAPVVGDEDEASAPTHEALEGVPFARCERRVGLRNDHHVHRLKPCVVEAALRQARHLEATRRLERRREVGVRAAAHPVGAAGPLSVRLVEEHHAAGAKERRPGLDLGHRASARRLGGDHHPQGAPGGEPCDAIAMHAGRWLEGGPVGHTGGHPLHRRPGGQVGAEGERRRMGTHFGERRRLHEDGRGSGVAGAPIGSPAGAAVVPAGDPAAAGEAREEQHEQQPPVRSPGAPVPHGPSRRRRRRRRRMAVHGTLGPPHEARYPTTAMKTPPPFHRVRLLEVRPLTDELTLLRVDVSEPRLGEALEVPGQYVQVRLPGAEDAAFLAVASPPGETQVFEFLVKRGGAVTDALAALEPGAEIEMTAPMGPGFRVDAYPGHDILLFVTGSGISAIRPVILYLLERRDAYGRIVLFFGARRPDAFGFADELDAWRAQGVEVHQVVSQPGSAPWSGHTGYVQDVLPKVEPDLGQAVALLCGVKGMQEAVARDLERAGLPKERILTNF
ncbi:MAG: hypothetical protein D6729_10655 [Deltaproteobacteria bacterium]|nr:MAG: hypothetical protein D6729_10655 [Deltaproteobacteria bacterium]